MQKDPQTTLWKSADINPLRTRLTASQVAKILEVVRPIVRKIKYNHLRPQKSILGELWYIQIPPVDELASTAFVFNPKFESMVADNSLLPLAELTTYHSCGYHGVFKPDLVELVSQIPIDLLQDAVAFELVRDIGVEIVEHPEGVEVVHNIGMDSTPIGFYGHRATVLLYKRNPSAWDPVKADNLPAIAIAKEINPPPAVKIDDFL